MSSILTRNEMWGVKQMPRGLNYIPERTSLTIKALAKESGISTNRIYQHANDFAMMINLQKMNIRELEKLADLCFKIRRKKLENGERK
jgi:hypothetical protein